MGTVLAINIGMILFYIFTVSTKRLYLLILSAIFHFLTDLFLIVLACIDPGVIPKIFSSYEK